MPLSADDVPPRTMREAVVRALVISSARILAHRRRVADNGDLAAVKQMRVGSRRLRSALQLFAPVLNTAWVAEKREALQSLADPLGVIRDGEVLELRLRAAAASSPVVLPEDQVEALIRMVVGGRNVALAAVRAEFAEGRWDQLLDGLAESMADPPVDTGSEDLPTVWVVRALVDARWRRLRSRARALDVGAGDEALHDLRIAVKRCRYAIIAVDSSIGVAAAPWVTALADLQDVLGEHHDAAVTSSWCVANAAGDSAPVAAALAVAESRRSHVAAVEWPAKWAMVERRARWRWL